MIRSISYTRDFHNSLGTEGGIREIAEGVECTRGGGQKGHKQGWSVAYRSNGYCPVRLSKNKNLAPLDTSVVHLRALCHNHFMNLPGKNLGKNLRQTGAPFSHDACRGILP
jgi:hypothetical protein